MGLAEGGDDGGTELELDLGLCAGDLDLGLRAGDLGLDLRAADLDDPDLDLDLDLDLDREGRGERCRDRRYDPPSAR